MSFSAKRAGLVRAVSEGRYDDAERRLEAIQKGKPNLIDLLDRGMILHLQGDYQQSNQVFQEAERMIEYLFTKSIAREAGTYLINDITQAYSGEHFERIYVHIMMALNYIGLDQLDSAFVEIRKIDHKLQVYADRYQGKTKYQSHAFAHYLSGLMHEVEGNANAALVSYRKALIAYEQYESEYGIATPRALKVDLLRLSKSMGFHDLHRELQTRFGISANPIPSKHEVIVLISLGKIAHKEEAYWGTQTGVGAVLTVAYPIFVDTNYDIQSAEVEATQNKYPALKVEDLSAVATKTLDDRMAALQARALARAAIKAGAAAGAGYAVADSTKNDALGILVGALLYSLLSTTERADTRSWLSLPAQIRLARIPVFSDEDLWKGQVHFKDGQGRVRYSREIQADFSKHSKQIIFLRSIEP